jgi:hypothetical protein
MLTGAFDTFHKGNSETERGVGDFCHDIPREAVGRDVCTNEVGIGGAGCFD